MIQATLSPLLESSSPSLTPTISRRSQDVSRNTGDTVSFSQEALEKSRDLASQNQVADAAEDDATPSPWETQYKLKAGTVLLKNGHKQVTIINDADMQILEYDGDKLVRRETGNIYAGTLTKDIEEFDKNGELTRRVHSELYATAGSGLAKSLSSMHRDIEWFENGKVSKELHDSMRVSAFYQSTEKLLSGVDSDTIDLDDIASTVTRDRLGTDYSADIIEYNDFGDIYRQTSISQSTKTENITNRRSERRGGMAPGTTYEQAKTTVFSVSQTTRDLEGNIASQVSLVDSYTRGIADSQQLDVNLYNKGELVQQSHAEATQEQSAGHSLRGRPGIFDMLSLTESEYSAAKPLDAGELLQNGPGANTENPATAISATLASIAKGSFNVAQDMEGGATPTPHSVFWETTLYQDGKKTLSQKDSEILRENPLLDSKGFFPGSGLTQDDYPVYLAKSSHSVETYRDGKLTNKTAVEMNEFTVDDAHGVTSRRTRIATKSGPILAPTASDLVVEDSLAAVDENRTSAAHKSGDAIEMTLNDLQSIFKSLDAIPADADANTSPAP